MKKSFRLNRVIFIWFFLLIGNHLACQENIKILISDSDFINYDNYSINISFINTGNDTIFIPWSYNSLILCNDKDVKLRLYLIDTIMSKTYLLCDNFNKIDFVLQDDILILYPSKKYDVLLKLKDLYGKTIPLHHKIYFKYEISNFYIKNIGKIYNELSFSNIHTLPIPACRSIH